MQNDGSAIYQLAISGTKARIAGTVQLGGSSGIFFIWIQGKTIVGGLQNQVDIWNYPAGGQPIRVINHIGKGGNAVAVSN